MVLLFIALIVMRQEQLRAGRPSGLRIPRVPSLRQSLAGAGLFFLAVLLVAGHLSAVNQGRGARGLVFAIVLLSLVLLTGYGGQVSLAQMTFVGVGAYAMGHVGHGGNPFGVLAAVLLAAGFGAAVALPTLRLRGLYLALATLAFAQAMDYIFFDQFFGSYGAGLHVARVRIPSLPTTSDRAYLVFVAAVFSLAAVGVLAIRRGALGRQLAALNDSPQACATLGLNITYTKLAVFSGSAGLAGLAGALYGGQQRLVTPDDFVLLTSLVILLLLLIGGRNTVTGALVGAGFFAVVFPIAQEHFASLSNIQFLLTGAGAITVGQNPNGIGGQLADVGARLRSRWANLARVKAIVEEGELLARRAERWTAGAE
jgi:branched-chain amino acid transport system permease protein